MESNEEIRFIRGSLKSDDQYRGVAQLVEYSSGGRVVAGSNPVTPTF